MIIYSQFDRDKNRKVMTQLVHRTTIESSLHQCSIIEKLNLHDHMYCENFDKDDHFVSGLQFCI